MKGLQKVELLTLMTLMYKCYVCLCPFLYVAVRVSFAEQTSKGILFRSQTYLLLMKKGKNMRGSRKNRKLHISTKHFTNCKAISEQNYLSNEYLHWHNFNFWFVANKANAYPKIFFFGLWVRESLQQRTTWFLFFW